MKVWYEKVSPCHDAELRQITQNRVLEDTNILQDVEEIDTYTCLEHHHHGRVGTCLSKWVLDQSVRRWVQARD